MNDVTWLYDIAEDAARLEELARIDAGLLVEVNPPAEETDDLYEDIFGA